MPVNHNTGPSVCCTATLCYHTVAIHCTADFYRVPETTGTALFTYAMAYGISEGILDAAIYLPVVERSWTCLTTISLHPDGRIGNCQPVGYAPQPDFGRNTTSSFCVGHFALAATAVAQLAL